ncbi:MAG: ParB/RepB/Spo0J family partition protein [Deltaproteobacteria bacterium]|jgi:ParB family chromosome partitioning protein|nr:ParB/RepB/Spo0J family partition protein [Deltaproteobacteria bacterium]
MKTLNKNKKIKSPKNSKSKLQAKKQVSKPANKTKSPVNKTKTLLIKSKASPKKGAANSALKAPISKSKLEEHNNQKSVLGRGLGALLNRPVSVLKNSTVQNQAFLALMSNKNQLNTENLPPLTTNLAEQLKTQTNSQSLSQAAQAQIEQPIDGNVILNQQVREDFVVTNENAQANEANPEEKVINLNTFQNPVAAQEDYPQVADLQREQPQELPLPTQDDEELDHELDALENPAILDGTLQYLELSSIEPNPKQPRQYFAQDELHSLAESIKESGLLQPILVRIVGRGEVEFDHFEIIAGERRFRAAKLAGLETVPAIVRNLDDRETLELSIIENVQRSDLNPIEEANAYQRLISEFGQTQNEIASALGKDRAVISNSLRLLKLCEVAQDLLIQKKISAGHGKALLMIEDLALQKSIAERIITDELSVRQVEQLASGKEVEPKKVRGKKANSVSLSAPSFAVMELEDRLRRALGTKVNLQLQASGEGEIRISFFSKDELQRILEIIEKY